MSSKKRAADQGLERLEVMGSTALSQYERIIALLSMGLGERERGLLARPVMNEDGNPTGWQARSGGELTPASELPPDERVRLETERDAALANIEAMIGRLRSRGAPGMVTARVLATAITLPEGTETLHTDGLGPVLVDWGSTMPGSEIEEPEVPEPDDRVTEQPYEQPEGPARSSFWLPPDPGDAPQAETSEMSLPRPGLNISSVEPITEAAEASPPPDAEVVEPAEPDPPLHIPPLPGAATKQPEIQDEPVPVMPSRRRRLFPRQDDRSRETDEQEKTHATLKGLVAETDEAFWRKQRSDGRVSAPPHRRRRSASGRRPGATEGNALVWLVPALIVGGITFYLAQSPGALDRVLEMMPESISRQFSITRPTGLTDPSPVRNAPVPGGGESGTR